MSKVLVNETSLQGIADAIREKNGSTDTYKPAEMAAAISAIEAGGGDAIKAFEVKTPTENGMALKNVVAIPHVKNVAKAYTNTANTISTKFTFDREGETYILSLATRMPTGEPTLPDGWKKLAWVKPPSTSTTNQSLYIAIHTTTAEEVGKETTIKFNVAAGQRHYMRVDTIGISTINEDSITIEKYNTAISYTAKTYENTIVIATTETATSGTAYAAFVPDKWYMANDRILYGDDSIQNGRLGFSYYPNKTQQTTDNLVINCMVVGAAKQQVAGMISCSIEVIPGKPDKYVCRV